MKLNHLNSISQNIFDQIYRDVDLHDCTLISNVPIQLPGMSFISMDPTSNDIELTKMADFIHKTTWCVVAIFYLGSYMNYPIKNIKTLIERNVHSNVFFFGNIANLDLRTWNRPAAIIEHPENVKSASGFVSFFWKTYEIWGITNIFYVAHSCLLWSIGIELLAFQWELLEWRDRFCSPAWLKGRKLQSSFVKTDLQSGSFWPDAQCIFGPKRW